MTVYHIPNSLRCVETNDGTNPIRPLMCSCLAHGLLLETPSQEASMETFKKSILRLFPLLIARDPTGTFDIETTKKNLHIFWKIDTFMESAVADLQKQKRTKKEEEKKQRAKDLDYEYVVSVDSWTDEPLDEQEMQQAQAAADANKKKKELAQTMKKVDNHLQNKDQLIHGLEQLYGVTFVIASPAKDFQALLTTVVEETGAKKKMKELLKQKAACELMQIDIEVSTGITVGASIVGFCTPDSNPYQTQNSRKWKYNGKYDAGGKVCTTWADIGSMRKRKTKTFAAGTFLQVTYGLEYGQGTGGVVSLEQQDIKISFRIPVSVKEVIEEGAVYPKDVEPDFPIWFTDLETNFKALFKTTNDLNGFANFENAVKKFTNNLKTGIAKGMQKVSPFAIMYKAFTGDAKIAVEFITMKAAQAAKKALQELSPLTKNTLMGIDVIYTVLNPRKPESSWTFVLVHHQYTEAKAEFPSPSGHNTKLSGALGKEVFVQLYP